MSSLTSQSSSKEDLVEKCTTEDTNQEEVKIKSTEPEKQVRYCINSNFN